jgi:sugar/nucleoside kinase (ribokinase family)
LTTLDVIQYADRLPAPDEKLQATSTLMEFGGPAANAAFTAVALGASATLVSAVGGSAIGRLVGEQLADASIDRLDLAGTDWQAPVSSVLVTGQSRAVISMNASGAGPLALPGHALDDCSALLVDGHHLDLCLTAAFRARELNIPVLLDGGSWKPGLDGLLPLLDAAVLSADFQAPEGTAWPDIPIAVSHGSCPIILGDRSIRVPEVQVTDTVGAGDVLHGALLVHLARHGVGAFEEGLRYAAGVASESCRHAGAHAWAQALPAANDNRFHL